MKTILVELAKKVVVFFLRFIPQDKSYGAELFNALNRMEPHFAMEAVVLRNNPKGQVEVYMTKRRDDDTAYPGKYHCPGSAVRNGEDWWAVASRLGKSEFKVPIRMIRPLNEEGFFYQEWRGWYYSLPFLVELSAEPAEGKWYPVDALPENTVYHHRHQIIPRAVVHYEKIVGKR